MLYDNINDAAHAFVAEFNAFPESMIETLMGVDIDSWSEVTVFADDENDEYREFLPMWGTMWSFSDPCDNWWLEEKDGIRIMSELGFRIYSHEEWGYFFGVDGAGYDFYEQHWIPLYKARGLHWHKEGNENDLYSA